MRDSHFISRFSGINKEDSPANIKPHYALDCANVIGNPSGALWQARLTSILIDFGLDANKAANIAAISSIGVLDATGTGFSPRLIIQQLANMFYADAPGYTPVAQLTSKAIPAPNNPGRLDYAQVANVLYFSSGRWGGKVLPGDPTLYNWGIARPLTAPRFIVSTTQPDVTLQRTGGITTLTFASAPILPAPVAGNPLFVDLDSSATWDASFSGTFKIATVNGGGTIITYLNPGPDAGPFNRAAFTPGLTAATGYQYYESHGFSKTGHWSTVSPLSLPTGPLTAQSPTLISTFPTDDSIDQVAIFRNLDGGGDWALLGIYPLPVAGPFPRQTAIIDTTTDDILEASGQTPPYDNGTSPNGKYLCAFLDRTLMCGIDGDEETVAFSGFDSINFGRPQESWPQFNGISVGQGRSTPNSVAICRYGPVIFCRNRDLFMIRGSLQDVTTSAPQSLSFYIQDYKFQVGNYSHFATQSTPFGIIFVSDSLELMTFDGYFPPSKIAPVLDGILKRVTPGLPDVWDSEFLASTDRKWYILSLPLDGSLTNNATIIVDLNQDADRNTGVWITTHSIKFVRAVLNSDTTWHLICAQLNLDDTANLGPVAGLITEFPFNYQPGDSLMPNAHWRSGYFGIADEDGEDEWGYIKLFRFIRIALTYGIKVMAYCVDGDQYTFENPYTQLFESSGDGKLVLNVKARAVSLDLLLPDDNSGDPINGLDINWNFVGKR